MFWLFSGDLLYESKPTKVSDERPKFALKRNITEINSNIIPPIDMSVYIRKERRIGLGNVSTIPTDNY